MFWLNGVALAAFIVGIVSSWRVLRSLRTPAAVDEPLVAWTEAPTPAWRHERFNAGLMTLHGACVLLLGALLMISVNRYRAPATLLFLPVPTDRSFDAYMGTLLVGVVGYVCGSVAGFPMARRCVRQNPITLTAEGVVYGKSLTPWERFSRFRRDEVGRAIRLYSTYSPRIASIALRPPDPALFEAANELIARYVPENAPVPSVRWTRRRGTLLAGVLVPAAVLLLVGVWFLARPGPVAWTYYGLATYLLYAYGGRLMWRYNFAGQRQQAPGAGREEENGT
jgi:hypothetical protein